MSRRSLIAGVGLVLAGLAITSLALWQRGAKRSDREDSPLETPRTPADDAVIARLDAIPLYRSIVRAHAVRSGWVDGQGVLHVEIELRALLEPRLSAMGFSGASSLLPATASGTIAVERSAATDGGADLRESWSFAGPAPGLALLDRDPGAPRATVALDTIPGTPSAMARLRLAPSRLTDPLLGGAALASWRDRVSFVENLLGRPLRAELAEDLAGPAVFALYDGSVSDQPDAIAVLELRRSDRVASLLDMAFGLGALAERASVSRYRGVPTGSFGGASGGTELALAVDGPALIVATSRARLWSAIDTRRAGSHAPLALAAAAEDAASWSAASASIFVRRGWSKLAHSDEEASAAPMAMTTAALWPEGTSGWRLDGHGPGPAITADPILPFFRRILGARQRGAD